MWLIIIILDVPMLDYKSSWSIHLTSQQHKERGEWHKRERQTIHRSMNGVEIERKARRSTTTNFFPPDAKLKIKD